jgi:hypothetical protein
MLKHLENSHQQGLAKQTAFNSSYQVLFVIIDVILFTINKLFKIIMLNIKIIIEIKNFMYN